jgi:hypothetical protein
MLIGANSPRHSVGAKKHVVLIKVRRSIVLALCCFDQHRRAGSFHQHSYLLLLVIEEPYHIEVWGGRSFFWLGLGLCIFVRECW